ncbi:ArdC family protein [Oerskovia paurometabola]|uniref:ArdC family protein n=1 Tax=Oerskovia paurometabola TaxID=162170 RepID=UPI0037FBE543
MGTQSAEEREAKLAAVHAQLAASVGELVTGDDWKRALGFAAKFRSRSFSNVLLIYQAHATAFEQGRVPSPTPTYVAGYKQWQALRHQVRRGEAGYPILAPVIGRYAAVSPNDRPGLWRRLGFRERTAPDEILRTRLISTKVASVWDVSLTDGDPILEPPTPQLLAGQAPPGLLDGLAKQIVDRGFTVSTVLDAAAIGGANGLTDYRALAVTYRDDVDPASACRTLVHELAHVMLHGPDHLDAVAHRGVAEVEAESVALMIYAAHHMDSSTYSVPYVSTWASQVPGMEPLEVVAATANRVRTTSLTILDRLDTNQIGTGDPPGLDRGSAAAHPGRDVPAFDLVPRATPAVDVNHGDELADEVASGLEGASL